MIAKRLLTKLGHSRRAISTAPPEIFDRAVKRQQLNNIAGRSNGKDYEYLKDEVARRLVDRLGDIDRDFPLALDLGCGSGHLHKMLIEEEMESVKTLLQCDSAEKLLLRDVGTVIKQPSNQSDTEPIEIATKHLTVDQEFLPFPAKHFDLIMSSLSLHWVNDLQGTFNQIRETLKPDGCFLGAMLGGESLRELQTAFYLADQEREGGVINHVSPFVTVSDAGDLMANAGLKLCTVDTDYIQVTYPNAFTLMEHLQGMGENNALKSREKYVTRDNLLAAAAIYQQMYGLPDGSIPATFQVVYMIGWAPDPKKQQQPLQPGSAKRSFKDLSSTEPAPQ